jgi:demethylspheroidene O-methyltransferase
VPRDPTDDVGVRSDDARRGSLIDRILRARDRLLASEKFQTAAAVFPLSRPIARARARALFDLCAGFVYSQILSACVQLRLFDLLLEEPLTIRKISERSGLSREAGERLVAAATALRLFEKRSGERYGLGPLGAALAGNPALTQMIEHHAVLYRDLVDPLALLRSEARETGLSAYWPYAGNAQAVALAPEQVETYSLLMTRSQPLVAAEVLDAYSVARHRVVMDVGGGEGAFLAAAGHRAQALRLKVFDLPAVAQRAKRYLREQGLEGRSDVHEGDFFRDSLPVGADLITLVRVALDHDDDKVLNLLRRARAALEPGGTLLIAEAMSDPDAGERMGAAYFGFYLLAMGRGRARTPGEFTALCTAAGFGDVRFMRGRGVLGTGIIQAKSH